MRDILFRGKRIAGHRDNTKDGTMLYGSLFVDKKGQPKIKWYDKHFGTAMTSNVDPNTVGQFTGLTDKNGKKIFEGDIVRVEWKTAGRMPVHEKYSIVYSKSGFFLNGNEGLKGQVSNYAHSNCSGLSVEVIGNIHDNPELIGGSEDGNAT